MAEPDEGAVSVRRKVDFHAARPRRNCVLPVAALLTFPAPGEDDPGRSVDLHVLTSGDGLVVDLDPIDATWPRVELGLVALPLLHLLRVDEEIEHGLRPSGDPDLALDHGCDFRLLDG